MAGSGPSGYLCPVLAPEAAGLRQLLGTRLEAAERRAGGGGDGEPRSQVDEWLLRGIREMGSGQQRAAFLKITLALARRGMRDGGIVAACAGVAAISPSDERHPWRAGGTSRR